MAETPVSTQLRNHAKRLREHLEVPGVADSLMVLAKSVEELERDATALPELRRALSACSCGIGAGFRRHVEREVSTHA